MSVMVRVALHNSCGELDHRDVDIDDQKPGATPVLSALIDMLGSADLGDDDTVTVRDLDA